MLVVATALAGGCATTPERAASSRVDVVYSNAAVAADHPIASQAGAQMLRLGGNAVDAAVATSFALSVVRPYSCGIGGGGFMLIHIPARDGAPARQIALNYRETSPAAVGPDYFAQLDDDTASRLGARAAGVPGTVAGLLYALEHYGTLDRATVLAPAIAAAERGFAADAYHVETAEVAGEKLVEHPWLQPVFEPVWRSLCRRGTVRVGDTVVMAEQARALRLIAEQGADAFYRGAIADAIVATMREHGGAITHEDLRDYRPVETVPLRGEFGGDVVLAMPPPSSGGIATLQVLGIVERCWAASGAPPIDSPAYVHLVAEAMQHAFADRAQWLADTAFVDVPVERLLDDAYLDELASRVEPGRTAGAYAYGSARPAATVPEDGGTSHLSVVDAGGMAVACTETINLIYGSMVPVEGMGFLLNDEMDDFTTIPGRPNAFGLEQSDRNVAEPGKRPLSSMSPTIVLRDGRPLLVAGASGGPRIITGTIQAVLACLLFDLPPGTAVGAPRFHHQWRPRRLDFEHAWSDETTIAAMQEMGHETGWRDEIGVVQLIRVDPDGIRAESDPRRGGAPAGW